MACLEARNEIKDLEQEVKALRLLLFAAIETSKKGRKKYVKRLRRMVGEPNCITIGAIGTEAIRNRAAEVLQQEIALNEPIRQQPRAGSRGGCP